MVVHGPDRRTITIGRYPILSLSKARGEAKRLLAEFTLGRSRPQSISFPDALEAFLKDKAQARRPSTVYGYRKILERLRFKGPVSQITHAEAARKVDRITAPGAKSHAIVAGKVFFNWCIKRRYITENPLIGITKPEGQKRKRVLSDAELKAVWNACAELGTFGTIVRLFILCGQRSREVAALRGSFLRMTFARCPTRLPRTIASTRFRSARYSASTCQRYRRKGPSSLSIIGDWQKRASTGYRASKPGRSMTCAGRSERTLAAWGSRPTSPSAWSTTFRPSRTWSKRTTCTPIFRKCGLQSSAGRPTSPLFWADMVHHDAP